jgi:hypothetical protein
VPKLTLKLAIGILVSVVLLMSAALGCGSEVDQNEPNDNLETATPLIIGSALRGSISSAGDSDIFQCDMSVPIESAPFRVEIRSDRSEDLGVEVGISLPDAWEGITWPGWKLITEGDLIFMEAKAAKGTLLIFVSGASGVDYSVLVKR